MQTVRVITEGYTKIGFYTFCLLHSIFSPKYLVCPTSLLKYSHDAYYIDSHRWAKANMAALIWLFNLLRKSPNCEQDQIFMLPPHTLTLTKLLWNCSCNDHHSAFYSTMIKCKWRVINSRTWISVVVIKINFHEPVIHVTKNMHYSPTHSIFLKK